MHLQDVSEYYGLCILDWFVCIKISVQKFKHENEKILMRVTYLRFSSKSQNYLFYRVFLLFKSITCSVLFPAAALWVVLGLMQTGRKGSGVAAASALVQQPCPPPALLVLEGIIATHFDDLWPQPKPATSLRVCLCLCVIFCPFSFFFSFWNCSKEWVYTVCVCGGERLKQDENTGEFPLKVKQWDFRCVFWVFWFWVFPLIVDLKG